MTPNRTLHHVLHSRHRLMTVAPVLLLVVLALLVASRLLPDATTSAEPPEKSSRAHARDRDVSTFEPGAVPLPTNWKLVDRSDGVTTWRDATSDDSVSVAAVEAAAAPLAAIVADVAHQARATGADTRVAPPRQLPNARGGRRDVVMELALTTRVEGRLLYVRQVWRRDSRAARDVVATWTSGDETWSVDPATTVPTLDLR